MEVRGVYEEVVVLRKRKKKRKKEGGEAREFQWQAGKPRKIDRVALWPVW